MAGIGHNKPPDDLDLDKEIDRFRAIEKDVEKFEKEFEKRWVGQLLRGKHLPQAWGKGVTCKIVSAYFDFNGGHWNVFFRVKPLWDEYEGDHDRCKEDPDVADVRVSGINVNRVTHLFYP